MNPFVLAWSELERQPLAALAVVILIALATAFGIAASAAERALRLSTARAADRFDLVVGAPGNSTQLVLSTVFLRPADLELVPTRVLDELRADAGVRYAAPVAFGDSFEGHPIAGTTTEFVTRGGKVLPSEGHLFATQHEAVMGARVAARIGARLRPNHGFDHDADHHAFEFILVGRMPATGTPWDDAILVPIEAMWDVHHRQDAGSSAIVVAPKSVGDAYRLRQSIRAKGLLAVFPAEVLVELYGVLAGARDFALTLARASQALVLAAVLLALFARIEARRASSAVLRALGAPASYVFAVAWLQCFALFAAGAAAGAAAGWALAHGAAGVLAQLTGIDIAVGLAATEWREVAMQLAALAGAATLPAFASLRGGIPEGLRAA